MSPPPATLSTATYPAELPAPSQQAENVALREPSFRVVALLFLTSGATGLVDQVCFSKYLGYIVGATAYAVSAVLAAFMGGLALGAYLGGHLSRRTRRPLVLYGVLELIVAVFVCLVPFLFDQLRALYVHLVAEVDSLLFVSVIRYALALLVVIVPTIAMGMTLPLLARLTRTEPRAAAAGRNSGRHLALLYGSNTLGGALGALGAAYLVLPTLGIAGAITSAGILSGVVGVVAIVYGLRQGLLPLPGEAPALKSSTRVRSERWVTVLGVLAFGSGALVFACEIVFTHLLALIVGSSAYVFGLVLAIFLICLFVGASTAARVERRFGVYALPLSLAATSLALAITLPLWDVSPLAFAGLGDYVTSFAGREAMRGFVACLLLAGPVTLMGLTFPLVLETVAERPDVGFLVGRLTAVNTVGAVIGSVVTGYVLLPKLGSERSLVFVALVFAGAAVSVLYFLPRETARTRVLGMAGAAALLSLLLPGWNLARLTAGTNVYFDGYDPPEAILSIHEDMHGGITTVARRHGIDFLYTNGKFQGNTGWEMEAQRNFAHYPSLFVENFDSVLVIGLGTGTTLGTLAAYPWKRLEAVDISPGIVAAAEKYFGTANLDVFRDPRLTVHIDDGRNFLLVEERAYDAICMELSSIWFAGAASLYSQEFYQIVKSRLKPNGVFQQWVQLHHIHSEDFAAILHTLRLEFRHVVLFYSGGQGVLVASEAPLVSNPERVLALEARPEMARASGGRRLGELFGDALVLDASMDRYIEQTAALAGRPLADLRSTDDNLYLEYATPRGNVLPWPTREELVARLMEFRDEGALARLRGPR